MELGDAEILCCYSRYASLSLREVCEREEVCHVRACVCVSEFMRESAQQVKQKPTLGFKLTIDGRQF